MCPAAIHPQVWSYATPIPQYGGNMHNNVVTGVQETLAEAGFATLRFNFRGVRHSTGHLAGPEKDAEDVSLVAEHFSGKMVANIENKAIIGYSYGSVAGLAAGMENEAVSALVAIAPPVNAFNMDFIGAIKQPLLVIAGDMDAFCSIDELKKTLPEQARLEVLGGVDHFYTGSEMMAAEKVARFLEEVFKTGGSSGK